ncbi:hypothetical protein [Treponema saccharophilum]|uniref:Uncharacterized protein n=1 Tax=Treponema saccharophilum DSM 2985 TaxID=907348 RepID=H7EPK7_9SPIR|nr:hypothetical protein [Treponema saccharophilum]EIC00408.1 hypothetical protein TresaDRAFT_0502 [Treponema saccharophilum DSM 2985]BDC94944.1 hypothetical protein TRSA_00430 [Treponema saccharophilum]
MTVFYLSKCGICGKIKRSFEFFDGVNFEPLERAVENLNLIYADDQIGFIIPCEDNDFPESLREFLSKATLSSKYFFAIIVNKRRSADSSRRFVEMCGKSGIALNYLNFVGEGDNAEILRDKSISFRSDVGMFVSKVYGMEFCNKLLGMMERFFRPPRAS